MLPFPRILWHEVSTRERPPRQPEPTEIMDDFEQVSSYIDAYRWGGPTSALQLHHLREASYLIRPGDTVLDLACGHGPLLLELAALYPTTTFIGADLSPTMLAHLKATAVARGLGNVSVLHEDIRMVPSRGRRDVDVVISTSALHHLPDEDGLRAVFRRIASVLKTGGAFYVFDFGLLKSAEARRLCVREVAKSAPALTAHDYDLSLQAAFPIEQVFAFADSELPRPFVRMRSALVDFFYFLQTPPRTDRPASVDAYLTRRWNSLPLSLKAEHLTLRRLRIASSVA